MRPGVPVRSGAMPGQATPMSGMGEGMDMALAVRDLLPELVLLGGAVVVLLFALFAPRAADGDDASGETTPVASPRAGNECAGCGREIDVVKVCSRCKVMRYCSRECQKRVG